jgi:hypothetical protein
MTSRNWLITGVSSGFGRELATQLLDRGDTVVGTVRRPDSVADLLQKYPDTFHRELLDVTDADAVRVVVDRSFRSLGRIDVVVSNAGYGLFGAAEELSDEQVGQIIATNLTGSIQLIRASLPHLRAQGSGRIIQISSYGGQVAFPGNSLYHATKWGIEGFAESVAHEWPCSTQPTDSPSATRPGWPPPSSPARTSSPRRCASSSDRRRCRLPSPCSRNASPALRHKRPWLPQPTSRPANSQNPVRLVAGLAA